MADMLVKIYNIPHSHDIEEKQGAFIMESFTDALNILICSFIGAFAGYVIYVCLDYRTHPGLYDMQSAPWYTGILYYGIYTIALLIIAIMIKLILCRKLKQQK